MCLFEGSYIKRVFYLGPHTFLEKKKIKNFSRSLKVPTLKNLFLEEFDEATATPGAVDTLAYTNFLCINCSDSFQFKVLLLHVKMTTK